MQINSCPSYAPHTLAASAHAQEKNMSYLSRIYDDQHNLFGFMMKKVRLRFESHTTRETRCIHMVKCWITLLRG